jgi:hypothetical protein
MPELFRHVASSVGKPDPKTVPQQRPDDAPPQPPKN